MWVSQIKSNMAHNKFLAINKTPIGHIAHQWNSSKQYTLFRKGMIIF